MEETNMDKLSLLIAIFVIILLIAGLKVLSNNAKMDLNELPMMVVKDKCVVKTKQGDSIILYKGEKVKVVKKKLFKGYEIMRLFNDTKYLLKDIKCLREATEYERRQYDELRMMENAIRNEMFIKEKFQ